MAFAYRVVSLGCFFVPLQRLVVGCTGAVIGSEGLSLLQLAASIENAQPFVSQQSDIFMRYMPERDVVVCGCGKCGSTSAFAYVYRAEFGQRWPHTDWPYPQEVTSDRWAGKFKMVDDMKEQEDIMGHAFSLALIRDPKERLISSWKSKVACDDDFGVDTNDRARWGAIAQAYVGLVPDLQKLRGKDSNITCMELDEFATALYEIKQLGRADFVDRHFLSQDLACFKRFPPSKFTKVATVEDHEAFVALAEKLHTTNTTVPETHSSHKKIQIDKKTADLLDKVTADEYALLGPYLKQQSRVAVGELALSEIMSDPIEE